MFNKGRGRGSYNYRRSNVQRNYQNNHYEDRNLRGRNRGYLKQRGRLWNNYQGRAMSQGRANLLYAKMENGQVPQQKTVGGTESSQATEEHPPA